MIILHRRTVAACKTASYGEGDRSGKSRRWLEALGMLSAALISTWTSTLTGQQGSGVADGVDPTTVADCGVGERNVQKTNKTKEVPREGSALDYKSFGAIQVFETEDAMWLFLDVDTHRERGGYAEPPVISESIEFRAYRIQPSGHVKEWRSRSQGVRAHPNLGAILRRGEDIYVYAFAAHRSFRLVDEKNACGNVVRASLPVLPLDGMPTSDKTPELSEEVVDRLNESEGFRRRAYCIYGYGNMDSDDVASEKLGIRIRFHAKKYQMGWVSASVHFSGKGDGSKAWLLDLNGDEGASK